MDREELLRQGFHYGNRAMVLGWRCGAGAFMNRAWLSGQIMVITHVGRRSGRTYRTPVNYARGEGAVYCCAGFGHGSDWYRNVLAHPDVQLWLPGMRFGGRVEWWDAHAEVVTGEAERLRWLRPVLTASGFAGRLDGFRPSMSDAQLAELGRDYPVLRMELVHQRSGRGGPGRCARVAAAT